MHQPRLYSTEDAPRRRPNLPAHDAEPALAARLCVGDEREALAFLSRRPLHTVIMSGLIRDNGLESPYNRGNFYGCRDAHGDLIGVALVGHVTLFEVRQSGALLALARAARPAEGLHAIIGERDGVRLFCALHADFGQSPLRVRRELFMVLSKRSVAGEPVPGLSPATPDQLPAVVSASAEMVEGATGVNPLRVDPEGFRQRTARHVERGRVWAWFRGDRLIFKVDVAAETPEAIYLEGLYVNRDERGQGHGLRCLSHLSGLLLRRAPALCLMVDEGNAAAQALYSRLGFEPHCAYDRVSLSHGF